MSQHLFDKSWFKFTSWTLYAAVLLAVAFWGPPTYWLHGGRICPNVYVENTIVGGTNLDEARQILSRDLIIPKIKLLAPNRVWFLPLRDCGGKADTEGTLKRAFQMGRSSNPFVNALGVWKVWYSGESLSLRFAFDRAALRETLRRVAWSVNRAPQDARVQLASGYVYVIEGRWGTRFNVESTARRIEEHFGLSTPTVCADVQQAAPNATAAQLQSIDSVLAKFTTRFPAWKINRTSNIRTACAQLNGWVVLPDQTFSFNAVTGERTMAKGYRVAQIFDQHEIVDGVGGGVCQVSTTLYNCVRNLRFPIIERHRHSLPVHYIRSGFDATVAYPYRDLKFKNTLPTPIAVWTEITGNRLTVCILGQGGESIEAAETNGSVAEASPASALPPQANAAVGG